MKDMTPADDEGGWARADPDKRFFIENLVKDIELVPAILDLADNSVDAARRLALAAARESGDDETRAATVPDAEDQDATQLPQGSFSGFDISLTINPDEFRIHDNCGGISVEIARNYAFRFGRPRGFDGVPGSVGEFGVGMKRALFKLGTWFSVVSSTPTSSFVLEVDVPSWQDDQESSEWRFPFKEVREGTTHQSDDFGTEIVVRRLHENVSDDFSNSLVIGLIREQLRLRHQAAIDLGLKIRLNGKPLPPLRPELLFGPNFAPIRRFFVLKDGEGTVTAELIAGIVRSDRKEPTSDDDGDAFRGVSEAGWWVFCNNRLLLVADKTSETGWGNGAAAYHPQFRLFRGYLYLSSLDSSILPWNTTKTGVDSDSRVWRRVQGELISALAEVQGVLSRLKRERESIAAEEDEDLDPAAAPVTRALDAARPTALRDLPRNLSLVVPAVPVRRTPRPVKRVQKIQYEVTKERFDAAMEAGDFSTAAELGRETFDYFYEREVEF